MSLRLHECPARRSGVLLIGDGVDSFLVAPGREASHRINPTARAIWELCDGSTEPEEMVDAICLVFAIDRGVAASDVALALDTLAELDLVEWVAAAGGGS